VLPHLNAGHVELLDLPKLKAQLSAWSAALHGAGGTAWTMHRASMTTS
jgi:hypothetical protein